jgi:hypothetical protein
LRFFGQQEHFNMAEDNVVQLNTAKTNDDAWDKDIVRLQQEMNIADLLREKAYLDEPEHRDDDEASDRLDNVRDAIDKTINEDNHIIAVTKSGRPILDRVGLEHLVEGLTSEEDKALVRDEVETRYKLLCNIYAWYLAGTLVPRHPLKCKDMVAKLKRHGLRIVWQMSDGEVGRPRQDEGESGHYTIINPTCTQCLWLHPVDGDPKGQVDYIQLIDDGSGKNTDETDGFEEMRIDVSRRMMEFQTNERAATGPSVKLVPLLREIYGDELAVGREALPLISPDGFADWMFLYLAGPIYEPQVIEAEAA